MLIPAHLRLTINIVKYNLIELKVYQQVLSAINNQLYPRELFKKKFCHLLNYLTTGIKTAYIINLYKLFDKDTKAITLRKMIEGINSLKAEKFNIDKNALKQFRLKSKKCSGLIKKIEEQLSDTRHKIYAHSTKTFKVKIKVNIERTTIWLNFADRVFKEAVQLVKFGDYNEFSLIENKIKTEIDSLFKTT